MLADWFRRGGAAAAGEQARAAQLRDGPTGALDQEGGAGLIELRLRRAAGGDAAALLVTHDLAHLPRMHRVVRIVDGAVERSLVA